MAKFYCVVDWNSRTNRADGFHLCSTRRTDASRLKHRMDERGRANIRIIERTTKPRGVESVRAVMARWGLKPTLRIRRKER